MCTQEPIRFYSTKGEFGRLGNFSRDPFTLLGTVWRTSEHLYQALKHAPVDAAHAAAIRDAETPRRARDLAWAEDHQPRADWDAVRNDAMRLAVLCKFTSTPELTALLLSTGDRMLIEASPIDWYWGEGDDRTGRNMLGHVLMEIRSFLRHAELVPALKERLVESFRADLQKIV